MRKYPSSCPPPLIDFVIVREEKIPAQLAPSEIKAYVALHMGQLIRSPFKETRFHFELLEVGDMEQTILLMLYPQEVIFQYESLLQKVTLNPVSADISSLCLYRTILQQNDLQQSPDKHVMVLQWSPVDHTIMVFHQNLPKFSRHSRLARLVDLWDVTKEGEWIWKDDQDSFEEAITDVLDVLERLLEVLSLFCDERPWWSDGHIFDGRFSLSGKSKGAIIPALFPADSYSAGL